MSASLHESTDDAAAAADRESQGGGESSGAAPMDAVRRLMDERRRFEGWLSTLETRREATPARVYERVRGDYESRLDAVIAELRGHTAMLRTTVADLTERAQALRAQEETRREERAENELRATVGEYSPERWNELAAGADADIERLSNDRGELTAELARVQEMLAQTEAPRTPAAGSATIAEVPSAAPAAAAAPASAEPELDTDAPLPESAADAPMADIETLTFDDAPDAEAASEGEAIDASPTSAAPAAEAAPELATSSRPSPSGSPSVDLLGGSMAFDELAFLKSVVGPRGSTPSASSATSSGEGGSRDTGGREATPRESGRENARGMAADDRARSSRDSNSAPGFGEPNKTLRCSECGTMNAPTEWYCERCGGELAAL